MVLTKEFLIEEYINKNKNATLLATELNIDRNILFSKFREFGISKNNDLSKILTKSFLELHYLELRKGSHEIAKEFNIAQSSVMYWLNKYSIQLRPKSIKANPDKRQGNWRGYQDISGSYWCSIKVGAKKRNLEFSISIEYAWDLLVKHNYKCVYSNIELLFPNKQNCENRSEQTASLDRIDSTKGYVEGNVQWVHKTINKMKQELDETTFINFCRLVSKKYDSNILEKF